MGQGYKCVTVTRRLWVRYPLRKMDDYLLIVSFLSSGIKAKRMVKFYQSTCKASKIRKNVGNGIS